MIELRLKHWRTLGVAASTLSIAACSQPGSEGTGAANSEDGDAAQGEGGGATPTPAAAAGEAGEAAIGEGGAEHGEAGVVSAYAGLSGDQLTGLRIQHLRGFVMAAKRALDEGAAPAEAAVLVQQGLLEVYDPAANGFGSLNAAIVREAAAGDAPRAQLSQRLTAADNELGRAIGALDVDDAQLVVRMVDIATGLYQHVLVDGFADPIEYQHSMGAALAAQQALQAGASEMRQTNAGAYNRANQELTRFLALWPSQQAPETPASYQQVLVQGSRVRLALSPYL